MMTQNKQQLEGFMRLFRGRTDAYGTGQGRWIKKPLQSWVYQDHLNGKGDGLGVAPLLDNGTVWFAAVDLDEPDFEAATEISAFLSFDGHAWIERSRSGNAHVWCFFDRPIEAWIPRGIMKEATAAVGKPTVEIFPKQDKLMPGMYGNYINLPYHGKNRPMLQGETGEDMPLVSFLKYATERDYLHTSEAWSKRASWLMITPPELRDTGEQAEFGTGQHLHQCAEWIIANRDENPVREGHRNVVYFNLAKMLSHCEYIDHDEAWEYMCMVRNSADEKGVEHVPDSELRRILRNAERGGFVSTGCDDPLMQPYTDPTCPIAKGN